jgi:phosphatidylglycerol lysyltransferase
MRHGDSAGDLDAHARARALVLQFGWNTTSYQILNPGFLLWFSRSHPAVVGYVRWSRRRIVAGAPVCAIDHLAQVAAEFEAEAAAMGEHVVYFGAETRLDTLYRQSPTHSFVILGAQPSWHPASWPGVIAGHASVRAQLHRAHNKGIRMEDWPAEVAEHHPLLQRCLEEWLRTRPLPPLHFLIEPQTFGELRDRKIFVALRGDDPVGFLVASPIPARRGWLTEQFVRGDGAPNGTAELMIDTAIRWMAEHEAQYVTLGLAPLSTHAQVPVQTEPLWLRLLFHWTRAHGRRFYNFDGLDTFKAKFTPERWEPVFAISNERRFSVQSLHAIAAAFTSGMPARTVIRGLAKAVRQEVAWLVH